MVLGTSPGVISNDNCAGDKFNDTEVIVDDVPLVERC